MTSCSLLYGWSKQLTSACVQVDDSGKVQRLRKVCPKCGPGMFMATHFNRVYWCAQLIRHTVQSVLVTARFPKMLEQ